MAAYAGVEDVVARAGVLGDAWDDSTSPGFAEIQRFLDDTASEIDAAIYAASGLTVPTEDTIARPALRGYNADKALVLAIDATWPGSSSRDDVADLRDAIAARILAADEALAAGTLAALMVLLSSSATDAETGASDFWSHDSIIYDYGMWVSHIDTYWRFGLDPWGVSVADGPTITKGMSL